MIRLVLLLTIFFNESFLGAQNLFVSVEGSIHFISEAPLEIIEAQSSELRGIINPKKNTFAFSVKMTSFEGFNSALQKEHFNENYLESKKFPNATFSGKFVEAIDFNKPGVFTVRAKGVFKIHGIEQDRIIEGKLQIKENRIDIESGFVVLLEEHGISIPRLVFNKIAEEINVTVKCQLIEKVE